MMDETKLLKAARVLKNSEFSMAFTGAGISVESGVPPFRGEGGIWSKYDPRTLELNYFYANPLESWEVIRELFYNFFGDAQANDAHKALAQFEEAGLLHCIVTQNIDNLHQQAGSSKVYEFHGNSQKLKCVQCKNYYSPDDIDFESLPPHCECGGLIKPDFIFFGESIPMAAYQKSVQAAAQAEVVILIGSTGEVMPAAQIPYMAKQNGATIIEVNTETSNFTKSITDIYLNGKAGTVMRELYKAVTGEALN